MRWSCQAAAGPPLSQLCCKLWRREICWMLQWSWYWYFAHSFESLQFQQIQLENCSFSCQNKLLYFFTPPTQCDSHQRVFRRWLQRCSSGWIYEDLRRRLGIIFYELLRFPSAAVTLHRVIARVNRQPFPKLSVTNQNSAEWNSKQS